MKTQNQTNSKDNNVNKEVNMDVQELVAEDSCILIRQDNANGNIDICPKAVCEQDKANIDLPNIMRGMMERMKKLGGKLRLVFEDAEKDQNTEE